MSIKKHGLSISIEKFNKQFFLSLKAVGTLTHEDYEIITPMIDSALSEVKESQVRVLVDGSELDGWELQAAWDNFKLGLKYGNKFKKIAIYGNKRWQEMAAEFAARFVSSEVKYFDSEKEALRRLMI